MKKRLTCFALVLIFVMMISMLGLTGCFNNKPDTPADTSGNKVTDVTDKNETDNKETEKNEPAVKIIPSETSKIEYEDYDNGYIRLQIPEGWTLETPRTNTYSGYTFKVYNPENKDYLFEFSLGLSGFMKSEEAREMYYSLYPTASFGQLAAIDPQTTEQFYNVWNKNAEAANRMMSEEFFVYLKDYELIENLCKTDLGGDVIRGSFVNDKNEPMQGLFTATVVDVGSYYMYGLDLAPLNSYHNIIMYAPDAEFVNWAPIYDHCLSTIEFTEAFMDAFNREQSTKVSTVQANAKIYDEISDMIMDSWEKRNNSYDIISQKRSDATLGYERVYDTDTGDVYRAYNGFTDDYSGTRYQSITDDMYTSVISGYIER